MSEPITREEYNQSLERIHKRVDAIGETGIRIEESAKSIKESVDKMCECVYGNGRDGLISKVTRLFERVSLQTKLIMGIIVSILGIAFFIIREGLTK